VLDEDVHPALFRARPPLPAIYLGIDEKTWERHVAAQYSDLNYVWLGVARYGRADNTAAARGGGGRVTGASSYSY
jgi:hypothetical protein